MRPTHAIARLLLLILLTALCAEAASAQVAGSVKTFEGVLQYKVQTFDRVQLFNYFVKNERIRVEAADPEDMSPIIIADYSFKKIYYVLPHREQYVELGVPQEPAAEQQQARDQAGVEKTGETDEIEGFTCDQLVVKTDEGEIEIWATKELGTTGTFYVVSNDPPAPLTPLAECDPQSGVFSTSNNHER